MPVGVRLISEIEGSNPAEGMEVRLLCLLCAVYVATSAITRSGSPTFWMCMCVCLGLCMCLCVFLYVCVCVCVCVCLCV